MHLQTFVWVDMCADVYADLQLHLRSIHVYLHVHTHVHMHAHTHVHAQGRGLPHVHMHVCTHVFTHVHTYFYTHVRAHFYAQVGLFRFHFTSGVEPTTKPAAHFPSHPYDLNANDTSRRYWLSKMGGHDPIYEHMQYYDSADDLIEKLDSVDMFAVSLAMQESVKAFQQRTKLLLIEALSRVLRGTPQVPSTDNFPSTIDQRQLSSTREGFQNCTNLWRSGAEMFHGPDLPVAYLSLPMVADMWVSGGTDC